MQAFVKDLDALEAKHGSTMNYQIGLQYRFIDKPVPLALVQTVCTFMRVSGLEPVLFQVALAQFRHLIFPISTMFSTQIETSFSTKNMQYPSLTLDKMPPPSVQAAYVAVFFDEFYSHADITSRMRYLRDTYVGDGTWSHVMDKYVDAYFTVRIYLHNHGQKFTPYQLPPVSSIQVSVKTCSLGSGPPLRANLDVLLPSTTGQRALGILQTGLQHLATVPAVQVHRKAQA